VTVIEESINTPAEAIDLGLPSGTLWASWNVGASKPEESGDYYAWGETEYKQDNCTVSTYSFCTDGDKNTCVSLGDIAGTQYDVAHVKWGDRWTIPTIEQAQELLDYCNFVWTKRNSVNGFNVIGQNGNTIFIPASGCRHGGTHQNDGVGIDLWLSKESERYNDGAAEMTSNHYGNKPEIYQHMSRYFGLFVRPVICSTDNPLAISLSNVSLPTGEEFTLDIISGNGDYKVDYVGDASKIFEVSVMGSKLTIKTLQVGDGKFIVADITGKMVTVTVNVTDISDQKNTYERNALVQLFKLTKGSYWLHKDNWCSSQSPAHWYGITYDEYNEHVKYINLANNNLTGSISIKGFENLRNIDIKGNNISSLTIDSCPKLNLGYGFRLDDITLDFLQINNCFYDLGQHFMRNANIKKILFTNFQKCGRIFLEGVVSDEVVIKDCVFEDQGVEAKDNSAVKTMTVENSTIESGRLGGDVDDLVIKNCTIGHWWAIGAKSSITIINSYIEGHLVDCSDTPDEVSKYVYSVIE
jgi:hypothetical protein